VQDREMVEALGYRIHTLPLKHLMQSSGVSHIGWFKHHLAWRQLANTLQHHFRTVAEVVNDGDFVTGLCAHHRSV
jgi:hypothetical protein